MEITVGMKGEVTTLAEREDTAKEVGSGSLLVYATPCMVALMEGAACEAIEEALAEGQTTVGTALNIEHVSATPVGLDVRAEATVTAVDGKVITFEIKAFDETQKQNLKLLTQLIRRSSTKNKYFDHMSCNYEQGRRIRYLISMTNNL